MVNPERIILRTCENSRPFSNDIAEEIRLFVDMTQVVFEENAECTDSDICVLITLEKTDDSYIAAAKCSDEEYVYRANAECGSEIVQKRHMKRCVKIAAFRLMCRLFPDVKHPWGSLTGIRPTRLLRELIDSEGEEKAERIMQSDFDVLSEKLELASEIVKVQRPIMASQKENDIDIYIGIPYCRTRCLYCSFPSEVRSKKTDMDFYIDALFKDISNGAKIVSDGGYKVRSMYMGGGTPTVLNEDELKRVLDHALNEYGTYGMEFTVEAGRPDTITKEKLKILYDAGVRRISINPQTMNQKTLEVIGRSHAAEDIASAFELARDIGFESINADIIAGLPGENISDFAYTLEEIQKLNPENFTVHTLAIKRSSPLKAVLDEHTLAGQDEAEQMLKLGRDCAKSMGMKPYYMYRQKYMRGNLENVGYALPKTECIYNIDMMEETTSIMAHGASAMNKRIFDGERRVERIPNPKDIATYAAKLEVLNEQKKELFLSDRVINTI
ncbi:MAG: coproporphyrinogen dehydrogenase HemZ [Clostridia bacterium]|nr:coproporphyrinogen dehydrogenase HemZ [Clostridia bacterium]